MRCFRRSSTIAQTLILLDEMRLSQISPEFPQAPLSIFEAVNGRRVILCVLHLGRKCGSRGYQNLRVHSIDSKEIKMLLKSAHDDYITMFNLSIVQFRLTT